METEDALKMFAALSQETRLAVVRDLIKAGDEGLGAGEIGDRMGVRQNTMSANLAVLRHAGLITPARQGRRITYRVNFDAIQTLITFLMEDCCGGDARICQPILDQVSGACN